MEVFHEAPSESSFVPVSVHQSQTPSSFYSGPPVLYFRVTGKLLVLKEDASRCSAVEDLVKDSQTSEESWLIEDIEVWVSSEKFLLWRSSVSSGVAIPYQSISLHALGSIDEPGNSQGKAQALYLEVTITKGYGDSEDDSMALNFVPQSAQAGPTTDSSEDASQPSVCQRLYNAVTDCADLHPDPVSQPSSNDGEDDEEGDEDRPAFDYEVLEGDGMPPPFPGSSGWITSENMHQFFDEEGNWRAGGLGPGAGLVRNRDEDEQQVNGHENGDDDDDESTKWRRTD